MMSGKARLHWRYLQTLSIVSGFAETEAHGSAAYAIIPKNAQINIEIRYFKQLWFAGIVEQYKSITTNIWESKS